MNPRRLVAAIVFTALVSAGSRAASAAECRDAVPSGPTARVALPSEPGERFVLTGRVLDASGRPLPGVHVYVFQTDSRGYYSAGDGGGQMDNRNPRLCGVLRTGADGAYRVETIRPARYATGGPPPHIHLQAWSDGIPKQDFHLTFEVRRERGGNREAARGSRTREARPIVRDAQGIWHCVRDLVVR